MATGAGRDATWSVLLEAQLDAAPAADVIAARLARAVDEASWLGPAPEVWAADDVTDLRGVFADRAFSDGGPAVRAARSDTGLLLAAHHGAVDGLGLLALMAVALHRPLPSSVRGVGDRHAPGRARSNLARVAQVLVSPSPLVARDTTSPGEGDAFAVVKANRPAGAARLLAATASALADWNRQHGRPPRALEIAVGASTIAGNASDLQDNSTFLRIRCKMPFDLPTARAAIAAATPQPTQPSRASAAARFTARALGRRMGPTALTSSLGRIPASSGLRELRFLPVTYGRSGLAVGAAQVADNLTIGLRARARDLDTISLQRIGLDIARRLNADD